MQPLSTAAGEMWAVSSKYSRMRRWMGRAGLMSGPVPKDKTYSRILPWTRPS